MIIMRMFMDPPYCQRVRKLDKHGCDLITATERDESLESYYISLVGGGSHE